ncbi:MAG: response regulator transcription factor [Bacteroidota bacterium]
MKVAFFRYILLALCLSVFVTGTSNGQNKASAKISGFLSIDDTWDSTIFLSHIPTFDDMYVMSNEMIIAKAAIDSLGYFQFNIGFLPKDDNLYRLHIIKKEDTPATLIIGGKDENHLFLIANRFSNIHLITKSTNPPFRNVTFKNSTENSLFHQINQMVFVADSIASESSASKRLLIENQLNKDLLLIADTTNVFLVSLFAIYKSKFESNYPSNKDFYKSYDKKWNNKDNDYLIAFQNRLPIKNETNALVIVGVLAFILAGIGFFLGKHGLKKTGKFEKLSIQERKIYELLKEGASNQEISNHFNIGLSTVKSHVSNIYSKLKVKSRKDIVNRR